MSISPVRAARRSKRWLSGILLAALAIGVVLQSPVTGTFGTKHARTSPPMRLAASTSIFSPIAAGAFTSLALTSSGTVLSWGGNYLGELGNGTTNTTGCFCNPVPTVIPGLSGVVGVFGGYDFNMVLKSDGTLWSFGLNDEGQLGNGTLINSSTPVQVSGLTGVVQAAGSYRTGYAVESNGTLWAWGRNDAGELGNGTQTLTGCICVETPAQVPGLSGVVAVAVSGENAMALTSDGTVWTWGDNAQGQVGNGTCSTTLFDNVLSPVHLSSLTGITAIAATTGSNYALASDGTVWDWGGGALARPRVQTCALNVPTQIPNLSGVVAITATRTGGGFYCCGTASAILADGTVWDWGDNSLCELGNNSTFDSNVPVQVINMSSTVAVASGDFFSIAERSDGTIWAWGDNTDGQLGDGTTGPYNMNCGRSAAVAIPTLVSGIALGSPPAKPALVDVALGDSYSSGEGNPPFENGSNYAPAVQQDNTYTYSGGNSCHRSLANYAKQSAPNLSPSTLLVDRTCSGAEIVPAAGSDKGPIVPTSATSGRTDDQVTQALARLNTDFGGLKPTDVGLVSVTMGGNDAGFGDLIQACLFPNIIRLLVGTYPNTPVDVALLTWVLTHSGQACQFIADKQFHVVDKMNALPALELDAQASATTAFPDARVLQLTYPDFVPQQSDFAGDSCGGMLRADSNYARSAAQQIDDAILTSGVATTSQSRGRFQVVDLQNAFGPNALCPADPTKALVNAIDPGALTNVIKGLSAPGTETRALLDNLVNAYSNFRNCLIVLGAIDPTLCAPQTAAVAASVNALQAYFTGPRIQALVGTLTSATPRPDQPPGSPADIQFDNSRLLFHPNAAGWHVMSCNLTAAYNGTSQSACLPSQGGPLIYQFNGATLTTSAPVVLAPGVAVPFQFNGFDPGTNVSITGYSSAVDLGSVPVSGSGVVTGSFTLPLDLNPGVHRVVFQGTNNGSPRMIEVLVQINGRPVAGEDYGLYFGGFTQDSQVDIMYGGLDYGLQTPDENGGVFVEVPLPAVTQPLSISITATGLTTHRSVTQAVAPAPHKAAAWAGGGPSADLTVSGSGITITGWAHSDGTVVISGHGITATGGVEYGTSATVTGTGNNVSPSPVQAPAGGEPLTVNIADWRPGGARASQLGSQYQAVPSSACVAGVWHPKRGDIQGAVVYVPCSVELSVNGPIAASIVAESTITVDGNGTQLTGIAANFSLASAATGPNAIAINGSSFNAVRPVWAAGAISLTGEGELLSCGVYGSSISVTASGTEIDACDPGT